MTKTIIFYSIVTLISLLIFFLWPLVIILLKPLSRQSSELLVRRLSAGWVTDDSPLSLFRRWTGHFIRTFYDVGLDSRTSITEALFHLPVILMIIGVMLYSLYYVYQHTSKQIWLFIATLIGTTAAFTILPDLILGGRRLAGATRYLIPCYLGIQLSVAYLLSQKVTLENRFKKLWSIITVIIFISGFVSCSINLQADTWWNKGLGQGEIALEIAQIINQSQTRHQNPLIITDHTNLGEILPLTYLLNPQIKIQFLGKNNQPMIFSNYDQILLLWPSRRLLNYLETENAKEVIPIFPRDETKTQWEKVHLWEWQAIDVESE